MMTLISEYLVPVLVDGTPSHSRYDHSAYSIQEIIKLLCKRKSSSDPLQAFEPDVRNVIEPLRRSQYLVKGSKSTLLPQAVAAARCSDDSKWLTQFLVKLFALSRSAKRGKQKPLEMFYCCEVSLVDHPALSSFILPYLVNHHVNAQNDEFLRAIRDEWAYVVRLLKSTRPQKREFAQSVIRHFFALFDRLSNWDISPGTQLRLVDWKGLLSIANDLELLDAAEQCKLYYRALMHLEFHIRDSQNVSEFEGKLYHLYKELEDADVVESLKHRLADFQNFDETMSVREILSPQKKLELAEDLLKSGLYERAFSDAQLLKSSTQMNQQIMDLVAKAALRLCKWEEISQLISDSSFRGIAVETSFDFALCEALYGLHSQDFSFVKREIGSGREALIPRFKESSMVSYSVLVPVLARFRILEEIEDFSESPMEWGKWHIETTLPIDTVEEITAVRCALLEIARQVSQIPEQWLQLAKLCRKSDHFFRADMFSTRARKHSQNQKEADVACLLESSKLYFARNKSSQALSLLSTAKERNTNVELSGKISYTIAKWNDRLRSTESLALAKFYSDATEVLKAEDLAKAYLAIATLADHRIVSHIDYLEQIRPETGRPSRRSNATKFWGTNANSGTITSFLAEQLPLAIQSYFHCIEKAPKYAHEVIPRVLFISFDIGKYLTDWEKESGSTNPFDGINKNQREKLINVIRSSMECAKSVPSAVWLNLITQLISRVDQPKQLEDCLFKLIRYSLLHYPHATLWHLMSVENSASNSPKFNAIWEFCKWDLDIRQRNAFEATKAAFQSITSSLIDFAGQNPPSQNKVRTVPVDSLHSRIRDEVRRGRVLLPISKALILTPESPSFRDPEQYDGANVRIVEMKPTATILPTLQAPKKIEVVDSNGHSHHFLVKQDDDLRKDMRMMEFASFVNRLLSNDRRCRDRSLHLITVAVVCLNEKCGLIEWVENTTPLKRIVYVIWEEIGLVVDPAEVKTLLPDELSAISQQQRVENFKSLLRRYPAVSHRWFLRRFKDLTKWFQARVRYTSSTAVWSILGYIVGLGDRHPDNMLLIEDDGSLFHVDFNCIFDKAKTLQVPETVPFRLTQNVMDAMGVLKADGSFRNICELVMRALRSKRQKLISVLRPFLCDPLLEWKGEANRAEFTAKLTLKEIERRLDGFSEDRTTITSPECAVRTLITRATDTTNLAMNYRGWQAYL
jgi:serine/threonine-protein kinase ATR